MPRELALYLTDIVKAGEDILRFTNGMTFEDYLQDDLVRAAVERKFSIIGEALNQALSYYPALQGKINQERDIVAFRHRVMHGYFSINDALVWSISRTGLLELIAEVQSLHESLPL
jgi:uncharacterized protein with HEPN domain